MGLLEKLKALFSPGQPAPPDARKLDGRSEGALSTSLNILPAGERGWITFGEARTLFSPMGDQYAFGEMDERGRSALGEFAAEREHRSQIEFAPTEGRVYFIRKGN